MANENKVGKRIKTYRENLKMTLADLAEKSGVGAAVIASIEDGEVLPWEVVRERENQYTLNGTVQAGPDTE